MSTLIGITTFKKNEALRVLLNSIIEHKYYENDNIIGIASDNGTEANEVYDEYKGKLPRLCLFHGKERKGIACNKNRLIRYFMEESYANNLLLLDDDLQFESPGVLSKLESISSAYKARTKVSLDHITGYWQSYVDPLSSNGFFQQFPVISKAEEGVTFHAGSQGIFLWFTKDLIKKLGYFNRLPYYYGYEHAAYSSRALMIQEQAPELYPILERSEKWFKGQNIPNNYTVDRDEIEKKNSPKYWEIINEVYRGVNLKVYTHNLNDKHEKSYKIW